MRERNIEALFTLDGDGPAERIDDARAAEIVDGALAGAGFPPPVGGGAALGGAAKLTLILGGLVAIAVVAFFAVRSRATADFDEGREHLAVRLPDTSVRGSDNDVRPSDNEVRLPDTTVRTSDVAVATIDAAIDPATIDAAIEIEDDSGAEITLDPVERPTKNPPKPAKQGSPQDLLAQANAKRAAKAWRESDAIYAKVIAASPKSFAAQTAMVASGSIHLEHLDDRKGALARFKRALSFGGALAEDARWGIVEASRGDPTEKRALDDFLAHHPSSPLAARAKARRAELE